VIKTYITVFTSILTIAAFLPYLLDTIKGKTKPHLYSWIIWLILTTINFFLQLNNGGGYIIYIIFIVWLTNLSIVVLGIKNGDRSISKLDMIFVSCAIVSFLFWIFIKEPFVSAILSTLTSVIALFPTIIKSWSRPHEETLSTYAVNSSRHLLTVLTISTYNPITLTNPLTWTIMNSVMTLLIIYRRQVLKNNLATS
jgi:hypothetical protein